MVGLGEIATAWGLGEAAFRLTLQKRFLRGRLLSRRKVIFYNTWGDFVDSCFEGEDKYYLAAALSSDIFCDSMEHAMAGDWSPPQALSPAAVWSEIQLAMRQGADSREVGVPDPRSALLAQTESFKDRVQKVVADEERFVEWYRKAIRSFYDQLHDAYGKEAGADHAVDRQLWEFKKQEATLDEIRGLTKTIVMLLIVFAGLDVGASGVDLMFDKVLDNPATNAMVAAGGTAVTGAVRWAFQTYKRIQS